VGAALQWPLGVRVARACPDCARPVPLMCQDLEQRICQDCGDLHTDAIFIGACRKCERVLEERATLIEHHDDA
jgi:hypothetical protein